jgi:Ser/Thr protein kinase RdoA (MazF antagonist)
VMSNSKKDFDFGELKAVLEDAYAIGEIARIEAISCDEEELLGLSGALLGTSEPTSQTASATGFRVSTGQAEYFLKRIGDWISDERVKEIADFIWWTEARNYALSPALKVSTLGRAHIELCGNRFQLFDFVTQEKRQIWMRSELSLDDCALAGDLLARLHLASAEYLNEDERRKAVFFNSDDWNASCEALFERIKNYTSTHHVLSSVSKNEEYLKSRFSSATRFMSKQGKIALPLLVHGDFHPGNVLFLANKTDSRLVRLVDFDYLRLEHPFYDVGYAFIMFAQVLSFGKPRPPERTADLQVNWQFAKAFLRAYFKAVRKNPAEKLEFQIRKAELMAACLQPRSFLQYTTFACFLILEWAVDKLIDGSSHFSNIYVDVIETLEKLICYEVGEVVENIWIEAFTE